MITEQYGVVYIFSLSVKEWLLCGAAFIFALIFVLVSVHKNPKLFRFILLFSCFPLIGALCNAHHIFKNVDFMLIVSAPIFMLFSFIKVYKSKERLGISALAQVSLFLSFIASIAPVVYLFTRPIGP